MKSKTKQHMGRATKAKRAGRPAPDWVALLERESIATAKPIGQLLAERAGEHHPELLALSGKPWGQELERIELFVGEPEKLAIGYFNARFFKGKADNATVAWYILAEAMKWDESIADGISAAVSYGEAEGVSQRDVLRARIWARNSYHPKPVCDADVD